MNYFAKNWLYDVDGKGWDISMHSTQEYFADCAYRDRMYDRAWGGVSTEKYDEYIQKVDELAARTPPIEESDLGEELRKRKPRSTGEVLESNKDLANVAKLPLDLLHLHDVIFPAEEVVDNPELKAAPKSGPRYWWDEDVLAEEFENYPNSVTARVDRYLWETEK